MNSVDRAAVPIDSALARRFDRIEMRPDLNALAFHWGLNTSEIPVPNEQNWESLSPFETGYLLLDRLNVSIATDLGPEFEVGQGLLTPILRPSLNDGDIEKSLEYDAVWKSLARTWDDVLFPQLEDRYSGRPEQLMELLHVEDPPPTGPYAWTLRVARGGSVPSRTFSPVRLSELDLDVIKRSLRWLTR